MKKVGICTHCAWTSNGSMLQAYALKKFLYNKLNTESIIISTDHRTIENNIVKPYWFTFKQRIKQFIINIISHKKGRNIIFTKNYEFFIQNLDCVFYEDFDSLKRQPPKYDVFIAGSDQIFNPNLCNKTFFLDFVDDKPKKISYAASMGRIEVPISKEKEFCRLLQNFDFLSVRECDNVAVIEKYYKKSIEVHIDPTFLVDVAEWRTIEKPYPVKEKYILVYPLYWDRKYNRQLKALRKKTGYQILTISSGFTKAYGKKLYNVGVQEFLWLIDNAEGVITSSFHGVALSTIFNKNLSVVINPKAPSRIKCLEEFIGLQSLSINEIADKQIDYESVNKRIKEEQERSYAYLKQHIYDEK